MVTGFAVLDSFVYTCRRLRVHMHVKSLAYDDHCVESDNEGIETLNANIPNESHTEDAKLRSVIENGCGCGKNCISTFGFSDIREHIISLFEMKK